MLIDVGEEELRVDRIGFRGKHQPPAVRRPTVPRVHAVGVAAKPSGLAAFCGYGPEQIEAGLEQLAVGDGVAAA